MQNLPNLSIDSLPIEGGTCVCIKLMGEVGLDFLMVIIS